MPRAKRLSFKGGAIEFNRGGGPRPMTERRDRALEAMRQEAFAWIVRLRSGEATTADTAELMRWRSRSPDHARLLSEAAKVQRLIAASGEIEPPAGAEILPFVAPPKHAGPRGPLIGRRAVIGGAIAASAAGILAVRPPLGLWPSLAELGGDYRTGVGQHKTIALARGVSVELNTRTSVVLASDAAADGLRLIAGEVAVDADHARRLVRVATHHGAASTLGGRFGVLLADGKTCVTCLVGQVRIATAAGERALAQGQQLRFDSQGFAEAVAVDTARSESWRRGILVFKNDPLREVVAEVNRYRPGRIILTNSALGETRVNAVFQLDRIASATDQIRDVTNASVTPLPGGVVLLS